MARTGRRRAVRRTPRGGRRLSVLVPAVSALVITAIAIFGFDAVGPGAPGRRGSTGDPRPTAALVAQDVRVAAARSTATLSWDGDRATRYRIEYARQGDLSGVRRKTSSAGRVALRGLRPGTSYVVRVNAVGRDGTLSPSAATVRFTTDFSRPAPTVRLDSTMPTSLRARWKPVGSADRYQVQLVDTALSRVTTKRVSRPEARIGGLRHGTRYTVRVRAVSDAGTPQSDWSPAVAGLTAADATLRVGTYNVRKSVEARWSSRRYGVAKTILDQGLDVVGLQEATPAHVSGGLRQYDDIVRLLGRNWALTRRTSGPTGETRTVYNTDTVRLVREGYTAITGSSRFGGVTRYAAWSIFEQKASGARFLFLDTHLMPQRGASATRARTYAAQQIVATVRRVNVDRLPVIIVGDFNSHQQANSANGVYRTITGAGYLDPLVRTGRLGAAETVIGGNWKTFNGGVSGPQVRRRLQMLDRVFVSPMRVMLWQTVITAGRPPSDHNLVRVTVYLPAPR